MQLKKIACAGLAGALLSVTALQVSAEQGQTTDEAVQSLELTTPGAVANIDGEVNVEEANFKVIVPASLPMITDSNGNITTANNAEIINASDAAVKITSVDVSAKPNSGWTLVSDKPSETRGANEFTFTTSLAVGDSIAESSTLPFTYEAKLSPIEPGVASIDLVTLTIAFDWEE